MPTGIQLRQEVYTRTAQATAIVESTNDWRHHELLETFTDEIDEFTYRYQDDEEIPIEEYSSLIAEVDKMYFDFVRATGGKEALLRERLSTPQDVWPYIYELVPA